MAGAVYLRAMVGTFGAVWLILEDLMEYA